MRRSKKKNTKFYFRGVSKKKKIIIALGTTKQIKKITQDLQERKRRKRGISLFVADKLLQLEHNRR